MNFALENWIDIGRKAKSCKCKKDSVRIDMDQFIENVNNANNKNTLLKNKVKRSNFKKNK